MYQSLHFQRHSILRNREYTNSKVNGNMTQGNKMDSLNKKIHQIVCDTGCLYTYKYSDNVQTSVSVARLQPIVVHNL